MTVSTAVVSCPVGSYTKIADNPSNCSFRIRGNGAGRMVIATSAPAANETNYATVAFGDPIELGSMTGTEDVYFMPDWETAITIEVIKG